MNYETQQLRKDFEVLKEKYKGKNIAQSSLFFTADIDSQKQSYLFSVLENDAKQPQKPDEIRLNQNDVFVFNRLAVGFVADLQIVGRGVPQEYGRSIFLQKVPYAVDTQTIRAYKLWAGQLKVTINNYIYFEKYDLRDFDNSSEQDQFNQLNNILTNPTDTLQFKAHARPILTPVQPMIAMSGAKKNDFEITLPTALDPFGFSVFTNGITPYLQFNVNRIGILLRGFLIQNAAVYQGR
jgi:hypothetical protein